MRTLLRPVLGVVVVITAVLGISAIAFLPGGARAVSTVASWLLIAFAAIDGWAVAIFWRAHRRRPTLSVLERDLHWAMLVTFSAVLLAVLAAYYLLGSPLPRGAGFFLLATAVLVLSVPLVTFVLDYLRGRL